MIAREQLKTEDYLTAARRLSRMPREDLPRGIGIVRAVVRRASGLVEAPIFGFNARVDAGAARQNANTFGTALGTFQWIACSPTTLTPAKADTTLSGEMTTLGFSRALASPAYTAPSSLGGTFTQVLTKTFLGSGGWSVNSIALFDQLAIGGTMFSEINLSSTASGASGDSLAITYTITA